MQTNRPKSNVTGFATIQQATEYLALSRATVYKLMDNGQLAHAKFGGARRIPWASLHEYAERNTVQAASH